MSLRELISCVRAIERRADVRLPPDADSAPGDADEPPAGEPNAPRVERAAEPPTWIRRGEAVRDRGEAPIHLERGVSLDELPAEARVQTPPIRALAYYLPFHRHGTGWGIYLRESGLLAVAFLLKGGPLGPADSRFIDLARQVLLSHERLHFQVEVGCARAEVVAKVRLYDAYFNDRFAAAHEEALANASAFRTLGAEPEAVRSAIWAWMKAQGPGYQDFDRWVHARKFRGGCRRAGQHILRRVGASGVGPAEPAEFLFDAVGRFRAPLYVVLDLRACDVLRPFPKAHGMRVHVHGNDHPPPHIHIEMPPGEPFTRYAWPQLRPLKGEPALSSDGLKALRVYLADFGADIDAKVRAVYGNAAAWTPALSLQD